MSDNIKAIYECITKICLITNNEKNITNNNEKKYILDNYYSKEIDETRENDLLKKHDKYFGLRDSELNSTINIKLILKEVFDAKVINTKCHNTQFFVTIDQKNFISHLEKKIRLISYRCYIENINQYLIFQDSFIINSTDKEKDVRNKIRDRWFWYTVNIRETQWKGFFLLEPNMPILFCPNILNLFTTLLNSYIASNFKNNETNIYRRLQLQHKKTNLSVTNIIGHESVYYDTGDDIFTKKIISSIEDNIKEYIYYNKSSKLKMINCILIYHSEGNHTFNRFSGECNFLFHGIEFIDSEPVSLKKIPLTFNIANLFDSKKYAIVECRNENWMCFEQGI